MSFPLITSRLSDKKTYPLDEFLNRLRNQCPGFQVISMMHLKHDYSESEGWFDVYQISCGWGGRCIKQEQITSCQFLHKPRGD